MYPYFYGNGDQPAILIFTIQAKVFSQGNILRNMILQWVIMKEYIYGLAFINKYIDLYLGFIYYNNISKFDIFTEI